MSWFISSCPCPWCASLGNKSQVLSNMAKPRRNLCFICAERDVHHTLHCSRKGLLSGLLPAALCTTTLLPTGFGIQRNLEKNTPLSGKVWCFHFIGSGGRKSWSSWWLHKRGRCIPLYVWEDRSTARESFFPVCSESSSIGLSGVVMSVCSLSRIERQKWGKAFSWYLGFGHFVQFLLWVLALWESSYVSW